MSHRKQGCHPTGQLISFKMHGVRDACAGCYWFTAFLHIRVLSLDTDMCICMQVNNSLCVFACICVQFVSSLECVFVKENSHCERTEYKNRQYTTAPIYYSQVVQKQLKPIMNIPFLKKKVPDDPPTVNREDCASNEPLYFLILCQYNRLDFFFFFVDIKLFANL